MGLTFTIETELEEDGRWIAEVMEIPGAMVYGATIDEATAKVQALALRVLAERLENWIMAMLQKLGKMEKVGIKQVWQYEASDFTPWLAENISLLSEVIDLSIEQIKTEAPVGKFSLDILARDSDSGKYVVIENQYGDTNHDHLGKLLTYAAGYDACAAIWVAESFTDEHRKALDLLNHRTGEGYTVLWH